MMIVCKVLADAQNNLILLFAPCASTLHFTLCFCRMRFTNRNNIIAYEKIIYLTRLWSQLFTDYTQYLLTLHTSCMI